MEYLHLSAKDAYDQWASTYDSMPNILVRTDNLALSPLRDEFISLLLSNHSSSSSSSTPSSTSFPSNHANQKGPTIVDLGCGTGRCTLALLRVPNARIIGLDISPAMLEIAESTCQSALDELKAVQSHCKCNSNSTDELQSSKSSSNDSNPSCTCSNQVANEVDFRLWDGTSTRANGPNLTVPFQDKLEDKRILPFVADGIISALVLEHFSLRDFFAAAYDILGGRGRCGSGDDSSNVSQTRPHVAGAADSNNSRKPNTQEGPEGSTAPTYHHRHLLLSNMHPEMGARTGAGFIDPATGKRVRTVTFVHTVEDVLAEANKWGFELVGKVHEKKVDAEWLDKVSGVCSGTNGEKPNGVTEANIERHQLESKWHASAQKWIGINVWFGMLFRLSI